MTSLLLTDDELALLRFTCDLFFVAESPVYYVDKECREPADLGQAYDSLVRKRVIDPKSFRLTDNALNRLAPLTECDARVVVSRERPGDEAEIQDFYLLDEIAVSYDDTDEGHEVGGDQDHDELIRLLSKHFAPRRSKGDFAEVELSTGEYLVFALLAQDVRGQGGDDRMSLAEIVQALSNLGFHTPASASEVPAAPMRAHTLRGSSSASAASDPAGVFASPSDEATAVARPGSYKSSLPSDPSWEAHLNQLESKGVVRRDKLGHPHLRPAFLELAKALAERGRTSFVRYDFIDEDWLIRETTFLPVEGGLFFLGPTPEGHIAVRELDQERLELALRAAVGPLPPASDEQAGSKKAKDFLLRA
ncbi:MAG: hypothetical protein ABIJ09_26605 [Pseudomonadota bacterium]